MTAFYAIVLAVQLKSDFVSLPIDRVKNEIVQIPEKCLTYWFDARTLIVLQ